MNTTLYVSKAGEQIYNDAQVWADRNATSLSFLVETLLDMLTSASYSDFAQEVKQTIHRAHAPRSRNTGVWSTRRRAGVSKRPAKKVVR